MAGHTAGLWVIEPHDPSARGHWLYSADGSFVALVVKRDDGGPAEELANAHLIAAAPDLLGALKTIVHNYDTGNYTAIDMPAARAAIAKAEGRA